MSAAPAVAAGRLKGLVMACAGVMLAAAGPAQAGPCTLSGGTYTCSGADATTPVNLSGAMLSVVLDPTFVNPSVIGVRSVRLTATGTGLTLNQAAGSTVIGVLYGVQASNNGTGDLSVTTAGSVTATSNIGILASNGPNAHDLTIEQTAGGTVSGVTDGFNAYNEGTGNTRITTAGSVTVGGTAVFAVNTGTAKDITIIQTGGTLTSLAQAIFTENYGIGDTLISTAGTVTGGTFDSAVLATNGETAKDITVEQKGGTITSGTYGIDAFNGGTGNTRVTTAGSVTGTDVAGVRAYNYIDAKDITVEQTGGTITGGSYGIFAENDGTGNTSVTTAGDVTATGPGGEGIYAYNPGDTAVHAFDAFSAFDYPYPYVDPLPLAAPNHFPVNLTINQTAGTILGSLYGIHAYNLGTGTTSVSAAGTVTGTTDTGVKAVNTAIGTDMTVNQTGGTVTGGANGIWADNNGSGPLVITTAGTVTGTGDSGIHFNGHNQASTVNVQSGGVVQGGIAGITGNSSGGAITLNNSGTIRNLSGLSTAQAIYIPTDPIINNNAGGLITGTVNAVAPTTLNNATGATWNTAGGTNDFDTTANGVVSGNSIDNSGLILAAQAGAPAAVATYFNHIGVFNHNAGGELRLSNGVAGDVAHMGGGFNGNGGSVSLDTALGNDASATDRLHITRDTAGNALLQVNNAAGTGAQTQVGIDLVNVDGASSAGQFSLANPVKAGAYQYLLKQGGNGGVAKDWYLVSSIMSTDTQVGALMPLYRPFVANYVAGQQANLDAGFGQIGTLHQRLGEQRHATGDKHQFWVRGTANGGKADGSARMNYEQINYGVQVGVDVLDRTTA